MKKDITDHVAIELLVNTFYGKIRQDDLLGHIFNDIAKVDWEKHLPKMYQFWETIIFSIASYKGNPMLTHLALSQKTPLTSTHFERWVSLWEETVDQLFQGENATLAKSRARNIQALMLYKIQEQDAFPLKPIQP